MSLHWFLILSSLPATPSEGNFTQDFTDNWVQKPFCRDFVSEIAFAFAFVWLDYNCERNASTLGHEQLPEAIHSAINYLTEVHYVRDHGLIKGKRSLCISHLILLYLKHIL